ncbi:hypothetical protein THRCLA_00502 [Thraustotheca clavata]|nr:hypothetical protein THRCLA_00502 [Thraustotheca clavata]
MPGPISEENKNAFRTYYSADIGLVHAVFLDDYVGALHKVGGQNWLNERNLQLQWLKVTLHRWIALRLLT